MASPMLEAGAIDGARGILINITGSSSLKLSEVNQASSLIQTASHEDANIIFGAVLDEKMGEEVKITVIATGFRDQMPERRARMLSVEDVPVVSVPVVAPENWLREAAGAGAPAAAAEQTAGTAQEVASPQPASTPAAAVPAGDVAVETAVEPEPVKGPARFMSEEEEEKDEAFYFASSKPAVATTVTFAPPPVKTVEPEAVVEPAAARFHELGQEPAEVKSAANYAEEFTVDPRAEAEVDDPLASPALFQDRSDEPQRDLDVPAFLRRLKF